ncbi:dienelactone hydrolase family protein [bacterium]|nr:dienelactone hydrolase family protein [bacterium]
MSEEFHNVEIPAGSVSLPGELALPDGARAIVAFAHGSGSSRHSPRNKFVAARLREESIGTLLFDLLSETEDLEREARFDIDRLTERLAAATAWLREDERTRTLAVGCLGASTGAAAALQVAAREEVFAVVSRGGRPDLAHADALAKVTAPTRLIVGELDTAVIGMNRTAFERMASARDKDIVIVPGATHLFEEPGTLKEAARLAAEWFARHAG